MSGWPVVFLGVMALALSLMAVVQVGVIVVVLRLAKQLTGTANELRRDLKPLIAKANKVVDDAGRAASLAALQVERVDRFMATTTDRVEQTVSILQAALAGPTQKGAALVSAARAAVSMFRYWQDARTRKQPAREEEDALFVG